MGSQVTMEDRGVGLEIWGVTAATAGLASDERLDSGLDDTGLGVMGSELMSGIL